MGRNNVVWYVDPKGGITAEALGRLVTDEDICYEVECNDGRKRDMYRVPWTIIQRALNHGEPIRFCIWKQQGTALPRRFDPMLFKGRPDPKVKDMVERLQAQLDRKTNKAAHS